MHQHRTSSTRTVPYTTPAVTDPAKQNRAAHGNIAVEDHCACGAVRRTNINGSHAERGPWIEPETAAS